MFQLLKIRIFCVSACDKKYNFALACFSSPPETGTIAHNLCWRLSTQTGKDPGTENSCPALTVMELASHWEDTMPCWQPPTAQLQLHTFPCARSFTASPSSRHWTAAIHKVVTEKGQHRQCTVGTAVLQPYTEALLRDSLICHPRCRNLFLYFFYWITQ